MINDCLRSICYSFLQNSSGVLVNRSALGGGALKSLGDIFCESTDDFPYDWSSCIQSTSDTCLLQIIFFPRSCQSRNCLSSQVGSCANNASRTNACQYSGCARQTKSGSANKSRRNRCNTGHNNILQSLSAECARIVNVILLAVNLHNRQRMRRGNSESGFSYYFWIIYCLELNARNISLNDVFAAFKRFCKWQSQTQRRSVGRSELLTPFQDWLCFQFLDHITAHLQDDDVAAHPPHADHNQHRIGEAHLVPASLA